MASTLINLKTVEWSQELHSNRPREISSALRADTSGRYLKAFCKTDGCDLVLSNGDNFSSRLVQIGFLQGALTEADNQPLKEGVGRLVYAGPKLVHGWYFSTLENYTALWDQVSACAYSECMIQLHLTPVEYDGDHPPVWNVSQPLLIEEAHIRFTRKTGAVGADEPAKRKGLFGKR
jgi:hypothetical protein